MEMSDNDSILCYNKGCGKTFNPEKNIEGSCTYHPGSPFFHDAYKGWSCCNRKCIDFTEFLNMKGCTKGFHSNVKPPVEEIKKNEIKEIPKEILLIRPNVVSMKRPDIDTQMVDLQVQFGPNFQKQSEREGGKDENLQSKACENSGCSMKYSERESNPVCKHHSGVAIFHEGLKYWSCCKKKAMDFDEFLKQKGCTEGVHCWTSKKEVECRFDWHQTATHVIATIYAKGYDPSSLKIKANGIRLQVLLTLQTGVYNKDWILQGIIDENESLACLLSTKVEIKLKKAEPLHWTDFYLDKGTLTHENMTNPGEASDKIDALELNDL